MTAATDNPWAILDELIGISGVKHLTDKQGTQSAFYGRCSTEDNQDPKTSRGWQLENAREVHRAAAAVRSSKSSSTSGSRDPCRGSGGRQDARLLAALKDPGRSWNAVVVGEGTRCWFGNQFSLIAPRFEAYGVELWIPELGGDVSTRVTRRTRC